VHLHNKSTQGLEIPMAVSDARTLKTESLSGITRPDVER
jgi:hypothetical protein